MPPFFPFALMTRCRVGVKSGASAHTDFFKAKNEKKLKKFRFFETTTKVFHLYIHAFYDMVLCGFTNNAL